MEINININDKGIIVCHSKDGRENKYFGLKEIKKDILKSIKNMKSVEIMDGNISIDFKDFKLNIKNYKNNKDKDLDLIIKQAKIVKEKEKKAFLRKRKIKRISAFGGALILSVGFYNAHILNKENETNIIEEEKIIEIETTKEKEEDNFIIDTKEEKEEDIVILKNDNPDKKTYNINFESRTESEKYKIAKAYYYEMIKNVSKDYGIDPRIILAIATQESGIHDINRIGPAMGLMQIELSVWDNQNITAFNYNKNEQETLHITKEKLKDIEFNIRVGCMIFQDCLKNSNNNLLLAIQMYNYGCGNIITVLKDYYNLDRINFNEAINNLNDDWINSRKVVNQGDNLYIEHVLSYIENLEDIKCINPIDKEVGTFNINENNTRNLTI